jgi:hypothetical protein
MPNLWFEVGELEDWKGYDTLLAQDAKERILTNDTIEDRERQLLKKEKIDNATETKLVLLNKYNHPQVGYVSRGDCLTGPGAR